VITAESTKSGIDLIGDIPWGTHFCSFYETKEDLFDILIPYFMTGLENNEFCLWIMCPLCSKEETKEALRRVIPNVDQRLAAGDIEIVSYTEWFFKGGTFDSQRVIDGFLGKLSQALAGGYAGMRVSGDDGWLTKENWRDFCEFEEKLDSLMVGQRMITLCTYPLAMILAVELFDVARTHQFAVIKRRENWEVLEGLEMKQAWTEMKRLNEELKQRITDRTNELATRNQELIKEVSERKRVEDDLRKEREVLQVIFDHVPVMISFFDKDGRALMVNKEWERTLGWSYGQIKEPKLDVFAEAYPDPAERQRALDFIAASTGKWEDFTLRGRDGRVIDVTWASIRLSDGRSISIKKDITERKRIEEELQVSEAKFRALSESAPAVIFIYQGDKIRYANPAMEVITGFSRQELLEMDFWDAAHPDFRDLVRERGLARQRGEPVPVRYEFKIVTKGGEERWVDFTDGKFELDGKPAVIGMVLDITERKQAEETLKTTTEQLRALTAKLESVREEEGRRIGRELHDEIGSAITSLKWDLEGLGKFCSEASGHIDCSALRERIKGMVELIDTTCSTVQKICSELRPAILDDLGLIAAIEWQAQQFTARTGILGQFDSSVESIDLDREKATALFRIVQEALTNILRHSQATRVNIIIEKEDDELIVEIKDNGRGITEEQKARPSSLGLIGMQERTHLIRGKIEIAGFPGKGTVLTVRVPIFNEASG